MAEAALARLELTGGGGRSRLARTLSFLRTLALRKPLGFASLIFIVIMATMAVFPGVFATYGPVRTDVGPRFQRYCLGPGDTFLCPTVRKTSGITGDSVIEGSPSSPFGTDSLGRDVYSRIIYGARWVVYLGILSVALSSALGLLIGVTSGYFGGWLDAVTQRFVDALMALPTLVVLLALPTMIGRSDLDGPLPFDDARITFFKLAVILGLLGAAGGSRVIRAAVIGVRSSQFLEAARVIGASDARIMVRHVIPNIFGPLMVQATIGLGGIILAESALSFLGFGVADPNKPTWGQMLGLAQSKASIEPWQIVWPCLFISLAVFSFNMLGDALRDLLDPRLRGAKGSFG